MDLIYKALAEVNRRKIIFWLQNGKMRVSEIVEKLDLTQATVSNHLAILRKAKIVECEVKGKERIYKLNTETVNDFLIELNRILLGNDINPSSGEIIVRR